MGEHDATSHHRHQSARHVLFAGAAAATQPPIIEPSALAIQLMSKMAGQDLVSSSVTNTPTRPLSTGEVLSALQTIASKDANGNVLVTVINSDPSTPAAAKVTTGTSSTHTATADTWALAPSSYQDYNRRQTTGPHVGESDDKVKIESSTTPVGTGDFTYTFPAHSITVLQLHPVS